MADDRPSFAAISGKGLPPLPIVTFLRARLDEEAAAAQAMIAPGELHPWGDTSLAPVAVGQVPAEVRGYLGGTWGEHFARWDPARVLTEVRAKRAIVEAYTADMADCPAELRYLDDDAWVLLEWVLKQLALPYADHPDYRPEWKP